MYTYCTRLNEKHSTYDDDDVREEHIMILKYPIKCLQLKYTHITMNHQYKC